MVDRLAEGVAGGRLAPSEYAENFADLHPPLTRHEAFVEADRCYFCYEAPCQKACPTSIDIALFIRQISTGNDLGAAHTILSANILGGMCARVCPTETLCEEACVREHAEGKPVKIGLLQRHATDVLFARGKNPFRRDAASGKKVAVVGAGPAGLSCAHRLAELGHTVTLLDSKPKPGGLNEYGIAAYKVPDDFAQREIAFILDIGGIDVRIGAALGRDFQIPDLRRDYDAIFLGLGLAGVNKLRAEGDIDLEHIIDAVEYIAKLRQATDFATMPVGRRVVVIGGGMTAIDAAVQSKKLGAEDVTIAYRRGPEHMNASVYEQDLARKHGVLIRHWAVPRAIVGERGKVRGVTFEHCLRDGAAPGAEETFTIPADMVLTAIGQIFVSNPIGGADLLAMKSGRIWVDAERRTSVQGIWAGGDCIAGGKDLTVSAVDDGKRAAISIDAALRRERAG